MKWMTQAQKETFAAVAALSPGKKRPWLRLGDIVSRRCADQNIGLGDTDRAIAQIMSWADSYMRRWDGHFVERNSAGLWRLTPKGKKLARTGDL